MGQWLTYLVLKFSCFRMKMMKFFVCVVVFAATSVTILRGRPTENDGTLMSSYLDGTVAEGRPNETIAEDGTIELEFESPEAQAKWMRQEDRRRKGLPLTSTTEMPTTTTSSEPTMWNPDNVFVNCWMC